MCRLMICGPLDEKDAINGAAVFAIVVLYITA